MTNPRALDIRGNADLGQRQGRRGRWSGASKLALLAAALGATHSPWVNAAPGSAAESSAPVAPSDESAITLAYRGRQEFDAGNFEEASQAFRESLEFARSPVVELYLARCQIGLDRWLEARATLELLLANADPTDNPIWLEARASAEHELSELRRLMPRIEVRIEGLGPDVARSLLIDGAQRELPVSGAIELNPGKHHLVAVSGSQRAEAQVVARAGEVGAVELHFALLRKIPSPGTPNLGPRAAHGSSPTLVPPATQPSSSLRPWAWASFSVGAASLAAGAIMGVLAIDQSNQLYGWCREAEGRCPGNVPVDPEQAARRSETFVLATGATTGFVVAGALALTGVSLLLMDGSRPMRVVSRGPSLSLEGSF